MRRLSSSRMTAPVLQLSMTVESLAGKSEPLSITHPTERDSGGWENRRAPRAEYVPAPPSMSRTGGVGLWKSISSGIYQLLYCRCLVPGICIGWMFCNCNVLVWQREEALLLGRLVNNSPIMNIPRVTKSIWVPLLRSSLAIGDWN